MRDANCIFCKIIGGEIPSNTIYEDDEFKVILDASPAACKKTCKTYDGCFKVRWI